MTEPTKKSPHDPEDRFFTEPPAPEAPAWSRKELEAMWLARRARHTLLALAVLYAAAGALLYAFIDALAGGSLAVARAQIATFLALAPVHAALWWWSGKKLLPAVYAAIALFAAQELVLAVFDPLGLARGVFLKLAIVLVLAQSFRAARASLKRAAVAAKPRRP